MADDPRAAAYGTLHHDVLAPHEEANRASAHVILGLLAAGKSLSAERNADGTLTITVTDRDAA